MGRGARRRSRRGRFAVGMFPPALLVGLLLVPALARAAGPRTAPSGSESPAAIAVAGDTETSAPGRKAPAGAADPPGQQGGETSPAAAVREQRGDQAPSLGGPAQSIATPPPANGSPAQAHGSWSHAHGSPAHLHGSVARADARRSTATPHANALRGKISTPEPRGTAHAPPNRRPGAGARRSTPTPAPPSTVSTVGPRHATASPVERLRPAPGPSPQRSVGTGAGRDRVRVNGAATPRHLVGEELRPGMTASGTPSGDGVPRSAAIPTTAPSAGATVVASSRATSAHPYRASPTRRSRRIRAESMPTPTTVGQSVGSTRGSAATGSSGLFFFAAAGLALLVGFAVPRVASVLRLRTEHGRAPPPVLLLDRPG